jgi:hypothetical protein
MACWVLDEELSDLNKVSAGVVHFGEYLFLSC